MAFVHDDKIKKIRAELLVNILLFFRPRNGLVQRKINFVGFIDLPLGYLGHGRAKGFEIVGLGLIYQNIAVGKKKDAPFCLAPPQAPDDLKSSKCFACACSHDQ